MKKKILLLALTVSAVSFAQKTWVTGSLPVKVEERTLFYNGDGFEINSADAIVVNQGNVQVGAGDFTILNNSTEDNFLMDWQSKGIDTDANGINDDDGYGQLILNEDVAVTASSKIALEKETQNIADIGNAQIGFPFSSDDNAVSIIMSYATNADVTVANHSNRLYHQLYKWNNDLMRWDRKNVNGGVNNWEYYIIRGVGSAIPYLSGTERVHVGTPVNVANIQVFGDHSSLPNLYLTSSVNAYNEVYRSYIEEYFVDTTDPDWGKWQYQYGNPYTSNLDLSYLGFDEEAAGAFYDENGNGVLDAGEELNDNNVIEGLVGVYKVVAGGEVNPVYGQAPNTFTELKATANADGQFSAGDSDALLIKPMEAFVIKTDGTPGEINFNDGLKTFSYSAKVVSNPTGAGEVAYRTMGSTASPYYQLRMNLLHDDLFVNKTYVVAQNQLSNGNGGMLEAINLDLQNGIFTKQELADGMGEDPNLLHKDYYINQINTTYMGIPIPVHTKGLENGENYSIDFDLCLGVTDLKANQNSYSDPSVKYYFHDIYTNDVFEIFNDSSYDFVKMSGDGANEGNRFELFYGRVMENLGTDDIETNLATTNVYQNDGENFVRFDKEWNKANIYVYTAVGQIVFMKEDVDTDSDYLLPLNKANITTYIIKIENAETGESISKKVIK